MTWKLVPVEPTEEMWDAGEKAYNEWENGHCVEPIFKAMLAAAPDPAEDLALLERMAMAMAGADDWPALDERDRHGWRTIALRAIAAFGCERRAIGERRLPPTWQVGHRVRYIQDQGPFGPTIGTEGTIIEIHKKDRGKPAGTYQVFGVRPDNAPRSLFWTTPDDVEWLASENASE